MPGCKLCKHPDRVTIERDLAAKRITQRQAAKLAGCNHASVNRHIANHLTAKVAKAAEKAEISEGLNVAKQLLTAHADVRSIFDSALARGDDRGDRTALKALEVELKQLEFNAKLTGQLNDAPQVNFLLNPEFVKLKQILIKTLEPFPDARLKLSEALTEIANDDAADTF
ncbi:MAG: hypothetical protein WCI87_07705 [Euryarchaeota archaeon]